MNLELLKKEFPLRDIEVRAGSTNKDKTKCMALAYLTSRAVMERLDEVCGPDKWADVYTDAPQGGVLCGISIEVTEGKWVTKFDGADNTQFEAVKGGLSAAFKRAGVKWGIGRYLYDTPAVWVECKAYGNTIKIINPNDAKRKLLGSSKPEPETKDETKDETKKIQRPAPPEFIKTRLNDTDEYTDKNAPQDNRKRYALSSLAALTNNDSDTQHAIINYLFGIDSRKQLTAGNCEAIIKWSGATRQNEFQPDADSIKEAQSIAREGLKQAGQSEITFDSLGSGGAAYDD